MEPAEYPVNRQPPLMANPPTPSFLRGTTSSWSHITCLDTTSIDEDSLLQKMLQGPLASMNSLSSESIYDDTAMTLIIDSNSNYLPSPKPTSPTNLVPNIDHPEPSSSDISNASNGSSGYPKSTETDSSSDDNQCVPDIDDREEELLSRLHYYGDFTIDRQNKINNLTARLTNTPVANINNNTAAETEELFTREVVGCEQEYIPPGFGQPSFPVHSRSNTHSTSSNCSSPSPRHYRSKRVSRAQRNRTSSSQGSRRSLSIPQASSTMIEDYSPSSHSSGSSKHRSSSIPRASSTMIEDPTSSSCKPNSAYSTDDMESVYCWSIKEGSEDVPLEESYYRNINRVSSKPPLPPKKILQSNCGTSLADSTCNNDSLSIISSTSHQRDLVTDSLYQDVTFYNKAKTLPRTSTRTDLNGNKSSGSSMEARRSSMPDMVSVLTSENDNIQSVPNSSASTHSSSLEERPAVPGKSSSSGSHTSPPTSNDTHNNTQALCDSLLTDSPNSVCSTGVFAPNNSPYSSRASPVSEPEPMGPPAPPVSIRSRSPKDNVVFKKPKNVLPLWKLFRFRRNKPKSTENITTTPQRRPSSIHSDPTSKKKLFITPSSEVHLVDKRAVAKKLRRFSESFRQKDTTQIHTLANL